MARPEEDKIALRSAYLSGLSMEVAASQAGVPIDTARRWKRQAKEFGDDWDRLRSAQLLAGGGLEEVLQRVLAQAIRQTEATLQSIEANPDMKPMEQVQATASLADSLNKMVAAGRRMMPETDALAVRLDTLKRLAEFVRGQYPAVAPALLEALQAFGEEVSRG
jgi:transposase-like protein